MRRCLASGDGDRCCLAGGDGDRCCLAGGERCCLAGGDGDQRRLTGGDGDRRCLSSGDGGGPLDLRRLRRLAGGEDCPLLWLDDRLLDSWRRGSSLSDLPRLSGDLGPNR